MHNKIKEAIEFIIIFAVLCLICYLTGIGCPIKFLTGVSCMGCGMTRACTSVLKGHIGEAFRYHPLFVLPLLWAVIFWFRERIPVKILKFLLVISIVLFIIVYMVRLFDTGDEIVVFEPEKGLVYRTVVYISE